MAADDALISALIYRTDIISESSSTTRIVFINMVTVVQNNVNDSIDFYEFST